MKMRLTTVLLTLALLFAADRSRTAAEDDTSGLAALAQLLAQVDDPQLHLDVLKGMRAGLRGRKSVAMPDGWSDAYRKLKHSDDAAVREEARFLALVFGDPQALAELRVTMLDRDSPAADRVEALEALVARRVDDLPSELQRLIEDEAVCSASLRGLAAYDDPATPQIVVQCYSALDAAQKQDAIATLAARPKYAAALVEAMEKNAIPPSDVSAFTARQIHDLGDAALSARLKSVWGEIRETSADRAALIAKYKELLQPDFLKKADLSNGRLVYSRTCMKCHKLYGEGDAIGPDLTGSNRFNLDYVLENALAPSAVIGKDYQLTNVLTSDGRLVSGIVHEESDKTVTLQTATERVVIAKEDIDEREISPVSMMPDGQFEKLHLEEIRDLVAYLATKTQVPLPKK